MNKLAGEGPQSKGSNAAPVFHPSNNKKQREMYAATCKDCGKACEVPFQPTPDRPAFCQACFDKRKQARAQKGNGQKSQPQPKHQSQQQTSPSQADVSRRIDALNSKLDRLIAMMESHAHAAPTKEKKIAKKAAKKTVKKKTATKKK